MYMGKSYNYLVFDNDLKNPNNMRIRMQITEIYVMSFNKLFTHLFSFDKFYLFYISRCLKKKSLRSIGFLIFTVKILLLHFSCK